MNRSQTNDPRFWTKWANAGALETVGWYNTATGIRASLRSLKSFHALIAARVTAGYRRHERLQEFCVLGRYWFDTCGNFGILKADGSSIIPKALYPNIPNVLTAAELFAYILTSKNGPDISYSHGRRQLPVPGINCRVCHQTWTLHNAHQALSVYSTQVFPLADFVGQTLGRFGQVVGRRRNAVYEVRWDIRNDRYINLEPDPRYPRLTINPKGWIGKTHRITGDYVVQTGDDAFVDVWHFYHPACRHQELETQAQAEFQSLFAAAGYPDSITLQPIANRYGSESYHGPWFEAQTPVGLVTIGWRKRVIDIDWSATGRNLVELFGDVESTKGAYHIHAWNHEEATDYLRRIRQALSSHPVSVS